MSLSFSEWLSTSPLSSILGIILAVALLFLALKLLKSIAKPLIIAIVVIGVVLIAFNIIDLAFIASTGEKFLAHIWEQIRESAAEAASDAISDSLSSLS